MTLTISVGIGKERYRQMNGYTPEGATLLTQRNQHFTATLSGLEEAMKQEAIVEAICTLCDSSHNLIVDFGFARGIIPREDGAVGISDGSTRDIALISRVNKPVCFKIKELGSVIRLSRREAQEECLEKYISRLNCGDIIPAKITHMEQFGAFVDIGCGVPSLIPIDMISISRIAHPKDRFCVGQDIKGVVRSVENGKITLSHKELLGSWAENADSFCVGETVTGIVRSVESYGIFVELSPNLAGLAELKDGVYAGNIVSVYIKAIIPEKMKIKLIIVDRFPSREAQQPLPFRYLEASEHIDSWIYSTPVCDKIIRTDFL